MKTKLLLLLTCGFLAFCAQSNFAQTDTLAISFDATLIKNQISDAPLFKQDQSKKSNKQISIPALDGSQSEFLVYETISIEEPLYSDFPEVRSYILINKDNPNHIGRLSTGANQVNIMTKQNGQYEFISPTKKNKQYKLYKGKLEKEQMTCGVDEQIITETENRSAQANFSNGATLYTYEIAIATTGEFYQAHGNTNATVLAKINNYLNLLNDIYENELAVHFNLIGNNTAIMFSDPATDGLNPSTTATLLSTTQTVINNTIGAANYDIGHSFHSLSGPCCTGSGLAQIAVLCEASTKASGTTTASTNSSDMFWMGLFAHEIGHQFGAFHSMYGTEGNCSQRSPGHGYEPGSGNSLMSYEGICGGQNVVPEVSTIYFHTHSLEQMVTEINANSCQLSSSAINGQPVAIAPANKTIPRGTPFELEGSATDPDGDVIYYNWEEFDTDNLVYGINDPAGHPNSAANSTTAPLFRSFDPSTNGHIRSFPALSDIINNTQTMGEILPNVSRNMNFRLTARDFKPGGGAISCDDVDITVDASIGPFDVTSQSNATTWVANGGNVATIVWNIAGTNSLCANVDILFSTDRGATFPYTLASNIANDGSHVITVPSLPTVVGRIKVKCSDNYFFDINEGDITISSSCDAVATSFSPDTDVTAIQGSSGLNLSFSPDFGTTVTNFAGTITSTDPSSTVAVLESSTGNCINFSNPVHYDLYSFEVGNSGNFTFSKTGSSGLVINIYQGPYSSGSPCNNFLASSAAYNGVNVSLGNNVSASLLPGIEYTLLVSSFSPSTPLPAAYSITPQQTVYDGTPPPPSGFSYTYVSVDQATNLVTAISASSDFTSLASGTYSIYGLSYESTSNLNPYIGSTFTSFQTDVFNLVVCGAFSLNEISLNILPNSNCPPNYSGANALTGTESGTMDYETDGEIESTQLINASATVDYDSGTKITLEAPFKVNVGATFKAFIDGCNGTMIQNSSSEEK